MTVDELLEKLGYTDGRRNAVVYTGEVTDLDILAVEERGEKTVVLECSRHENVARQVLDAYFETRLPLAFDASTPPERKTTLEIQDDLRDMYDVDREDITRYLLDHAYTMATEADGTLRWRIWRRLDKDYDI